MRNVKQVKAADLFELVREVFKEDRHAWITVTGMSMYPFLREGRDSVELSKTSFERIKRGDIVLIRRKCGAYVLHRVLKKRKNCFYMIGDAQQWVEGPLMPEQLHAVVTRIKRRQKIIKCSNIFLKTAVGFWLLLIPFRYKIIKAGKLVFRLIRRQ